MRVADQSDKQSVPQGGGTWAARHSYAPMGPHSTSPDPRKRVLVHRVDLPPPTRREQVRANLPDRQEAELTPAVLRGALG